MGKYLLKVSYSSDGLKGVMKEGGTSRVKAVERALAGVGGSLEAFYFAFGGDDVYVIVDVPDHAAAVAMAGAADVQIIYSTISRAAPTPGGSKLWCMRGLGPKAKVERPGCYARLSMGCMPAR